MTALNRTSLSHPRTQWSIEAAMWRAIEHSSQSIGGHGLARACSASGKQIVSVWHDRNEVPAFSFYRNGQDVTAAVVAALRAQHG